MAEDLEIGIAGGKLLSTLQEIRSQLEKIKDANTEVSKEIKSSMETATGAESKYSKELAENLKKLDDQKLLIGEIKNQLDKYDRSKEAAFSGKDESEYLKKIQALEKQIEELNKAINKTGDNSKKGFKKAADGVEDVDKKTNKFLSSVKGGLKILGAFFAVRQIITFANELRKAVVSITAEFGKYEAVLTNALGSKSAARQGMADILLFAAKTPFEVDQITESYIKLVNRGFVPTLKQLRQIGDLAASQGKSLDQLVEAILDAQTGEYERLKEFGIKASAANDKVTISFKGQTQTIQKNEESIRNAILALGDMKGVSGGMATISQELTGKFSNLSDIWTQIFGGVGSKNRGIINNAIDGILSLSNKIKSYFDIDAASQLRSEKSEVNALAIAILSAGENQALRNNNIQVLVNKYPEFLKGLDAEKISNEEIASRLLVVNKQYERRIELTQKQILATKAEQEFTDILSKNAESIGKVIRLAQRLNVDMSNIDLTNANDVVSLGDKLSTLLDSDNKSNATFLSQIGKLINGEIHSVTSLNKTIDDILNSTKNASDALKQYENAQSLVNKEQEESNKINQEAISSLKAKNAQIILDRKNQKISAEEAEKQLTANKAEIARIESGLVDLTKLFDKIDPEKNTNNPGAITAAIARVKKLSELETQLANTKLELLNDGYSKEKVLEKTRYENTIRQLNAELFEIKNKYGERSREYQLLNETIETENRVHTAKMLIIDKKYNDERKDVFLSAQDKIDEAFSTSKANELQQLARQLQKDLKELDKYAPDLFPSANKGTQQYNQQIKERDSFLETRGKLIESYKVKELAINSKYNEQEIEQQKEFQLDVIDSLRVAGINEESLTKIKESMKLSVLEEYHYKRLKLIAEQAGIEQTISKESVDKYQEYLLNSIKSGKQPVDLLTFLNINLSGLSEEKKQKTRAAIQKIVDDIARTGEEIVKNKKRAFSISDALGFTDDEIDKINGSVDKIKAAYLSILDSMAETTQRSIDAKQEEIDRYSDQISDLETEINKELALKEAGYTSNVELKQSEINRLKDLRDKEIRDQEAAQKKLERIEKAKQVAAIATTAASMVKSVATIIETATSELGWVGAIIGIAEAAAVVAGFFEIKKSIDAIQSYGDGGKVSGKYHSQGGNKYISMDGNDPSVVEIERDEFIVNRKSTAKYEPLINAINEDSLSSLTYDQLMSMISPGKVQFKKDKLAGIAKKSEQSITSGRYSGTSKNTEYLEDIANTNRALLGIEKEKETIIQYPDRTIVRNGNRTRVIYNK